MTSQLRAKERFKKIVATTWSGLVARAVTIGVSLILVPIAVNYLGKEQYGIWVTVSSLVAMLAFLDGGAGNAVINLIAHASGSKKDVVTKVVSTAFFSLIMLAIIGCCLFALIFNFVPWGSLLGITESTSLSDLNMVVLMVGLFFFASMFTTLVGKIQRGLQEGNLDNFWVGLGAILSLAFVYIAIQQDAGLIGFVVAFLAGSMFAYVASNVHYFFLYRRELRPKFANVDGTIAKELFAVGGMFFILQIAGAIQGHADNIIIANMLGASAVTSYAITMKLFLLVPMLFGLVLTPLWPAYREAFASGDIEWVQRIFAKSIRWSLIVSIPSAFALIMLGGVIIEFWVGIEVVPSINLLIGCGLWLILMTIGNALGVFLNGLQLIKIQLVVATISSVMSILLSVWLLQVYGVAGVIFGAVIAYSLFTILPYFFIIKRVCRDLELNDSSRSIANGL